MACLWYASAGTSRRWLGTSCNNAEVFEEVQRPWEDVAAEIKLKLAELGFECGAGIPYNYGIWKPKESKFRCIAGTRAPEREHTSDISDQQPQQHQNQPAHLARHLELQPTPFASHL